MPDFTAAMIFRNAEQGKRLLELSKSREMRLVVLLTSLLFAASAQADCWQDSAKRYGVDPLLLKAIAWKESRGRTDAVGPLLKGGNQAHGAMQINTVHLAKLRRSGIEKKDLHDACVAIEVGAWALAKCVEQYGETWKAVGCYNTGPASKDVDAQERYVRDVKRYYEGFRRQQEQREAQLLSTQKKG